MRDLGKTYPFCLVCTMAAGALGGWMDAFVVSVVLFLWIVWRES